MKGTVKTRKLPEGNVGYRSEPKGIYMEYIYDDWKEEKNRDIYTNDWKGLKGTERD